MLLQWILFWFQINSAFQIHQSRLLLALTSEVLYLALVYLESAIYLKPKEKSIAATFATALDYPVLWPCGNSLVRPRNGTPTSGKEQGIPANGSLLLPCFAGVDGGPEFVVAGGEDNLYRLRIRSR